MKGKLQTSKEGVFRVEGPFKQRSQGTSVAEGAFHSAELTSTSGGTSVCVCASARWSGMLVQ